MEIGVVHDVSSRSASYPAHRQRSRSQGRREPKGKAIDFDQPPSTTCHSISPGEISDLTGSPAAWNNRRGERRNVQLRMTGDFCFFFLNVRNFPTAIFDGWIDREGCFVRCLTLFSKKVCKYFCIGEFRQDAQKLSSSVNEAKLSDSREKSTYVGTLLLDET